MDEHQISIEHTAYRFILSECPAAIELIAKLLRAGNSPQQVARVFRASFLSEHIELAAEHMFKNCLHLPDRQTELLPTVEGF